MYGTVLPAPSYGVVLARMPHCFSSSCVYPVSEKNSSQWSYTFLLFSLRLPMHSSGSHSRSGQTLCGCFCCNSLSEQHMHMSAARWRSRGRRTAASVGEDSEGIADCVQHSCGGGSHLALRGGCTKPVPSKGDTCMAPQDVSERSCLR